MLHHPITCLLTGNTKGIQDAIQIPDGGGGGAAGDSLKKTGVRVTLFLALRGVRNPTYEVNQMAFQSQKS